MAKETKKELDKKTTKDAAKKTTKKTAKKALKESANEELNELEKLGYKIPQHVAIIMDGNGRWAKKRHRPRNYGHVRGAKAVEQICEDAWNLGIKYLTVYAFSTENWKRPNDEVDALMKLLGDYLTDCIERTTKNNMRVRVIGDKRRLDKRLKLQIDHLEKVSAKNTGLNFTIALNYGSRDEMVRAINQVMYDLAQGKLVAGDMTEQVFSTYLDTAELPDPDLMIRTSGEQRLSNWLLWQLAYSEFYFTDVLWPDFNKQELIEAIKYYNSRNRRFGGV